MAVQVAPSRMKRAYINNKEGSTENFPLFLTDRYLVLYYSGCSDTRPRLGSES